MNGENQRPQKIPRLSQIMEFPPAAENINLEGFSASSTETEPPKN